MITPAIALTTALLMGMTGVSAQPQQTPPPACEAEGFHQFDFWIGEWRVTATANGNFAGHNSIQPAENGCLLRESWTGASGGTGSSINFYNPVSDQWRQIWHASGGGGYMIDYVGGLNEEGAMELEGEILQHRPAHADGPTSFPFRGKWTPRADGTVRQQFWQYNPSNDEWAVWFDGTYTRVEMEPKSSD